MDYEDTREDIVSAPKVTFFTQIIEGKRKEIVWSSNSTNRGNDGVIFFDAGKVNTAYDLAGRMVAEIVEKLQGVPVPPETITR